MNLYAQNIIDHYKNPRNFGTLKGKRISHNEANYSCGDKLMVDIKLKGDYILDIKFSGAGCAISQAAMSMLTEYIIDKKVKEVLKIKYSIIEKILGIKVTESRRKCAELGLKTVQNALKNI